MTRLLLGPRAVTEGLRAAPERIAVVYTEGEATAAPLAAVVALAREHKVRHEPRDRDELDAIAGGSRHQSVLAITGDYPYVGLHELLAACPERPVLVALDQVQDPHNFGAIVRSAVAFGASGVITLKDRAAPVTAAVVRASAGATELARIARVTNLARTLVELRERGLQVVGLDAEGTRALHTVPAQTGGRVLVVGSEGHGLRRLTREQCDWLARIELRGPLGSLNAAVAAGIAIYESTRQSGT
ncbi:MAG: 23S rRNA (guanosine(2251)-2'-O)-methyltransferase RlmB [Polyangiales bacterium]